MRQNPQYIFRYLFNIPYLLPIGQSIADFRRGLKLNDTGVYVWQLLEQELSREQIIKNCAAHYEIPEDALSDFERDMHQFLTALTARGVLLDTVTYASPITEKHYLRIADLTLCLEGDKESFPSQFAAFRIDQPAHVDQLVRILTDKPIYKESGKLLLRNEELMVLETFDGYTLLFPTFPRIGELQISKDGAKVTVYCNPASPTADPSTAQTELCEMLFHALRPAFLYLALKHHKTAIHSASILYRERAWIFSGPSGTGKSTHTNLWKEILSVPVLNGDLNLLSMSKDSPMIHGIPWCGTSGISTTASHPLGGIVLLQQHPTNQVVPLSEDTKRLLILQRLISPNWTETLYDESISIVNALVPDLLVCRLQCRPDAEAVETVKAEIDRFLD